MSHLITDEPAQQQPTAGTRADDLEVTSFEHTLAITFRAIELERLRDAIGCFDQAALAAFRDGGRIRIRVYL